MKTKDKIDNDIDSLAYKEISFSDMNYSVTVRSVDKTDSLTKIGDIALAILNEIRKEK